MKRATQKQRLSPCPVAHAFKCYLNGEEVRDRNLLSTFNENEISIFESLRTYNGKIFRFEQHLKRLIESANACGVELPPYDLLCAMVRRAIVHGTSDGFIRITVWQGKPYVMIGERKHKPTIYETGVDLKTSSFRVPSGKATDSQSKTGNYRLQILAAEPRAKDQEPSYEYLFLDENHYLTECRVGNFFIVKNGQVLTPPGRSVLNGITRGVVIECARESGLLVHEMLLTRHEAFNADEAFLTNTSWEILPVRSLDGRFIQKPVPGPVTQKLIQCFHRKVERECHLPKKSNVRLSPSRIKKG